jgi:hypothetical protein
LWGKFFVGENKFYRIGWRRLKERIKRVRYIVRNYFKIIKRSRQVWKKEFVIGWRRWKERIKGVRYIFRKYFKIINRRRQVWKNDFVEFFLLSRGSCRSINK